MVTLCVQSYAAAAAWEGASRFKAVSDSSRPSQPALPQRIGWLISFGRCKRLDSIA
jgi:hypothetical protein